MKALQCVAKTLLIIGGLNWGLVGLFQFDLVNYVFVESLSIPVLAQAVYILVGLSAVYMLFMLCPCHSGSCCKSEESCCKKD